MKTVLIGVVFAMAAAPALACNSEMLSVQDWQAVENQGNKFFPVDLSATVQYNGPRTYRMIHAGVMLSDVLGRSVGQVNLNEDQQVAPGEAIAVDGYVSADERLLTISRDDIVTRTCVWSIVYDDGTVEKFD